jgi:hypothetical protein
LVAPAAWAQTDAGIGIRGAILQTLMGTKESLMNLAATNRAQREEIRILRRQNAKMRDALLHECEVCRVCRCDTRQRLFNEAFSRQLQTLRTRRDYAS